MKKKKKYRCVFFSVAGTHEKKKNIKKNEKKKVGAEIGMGYCPNCIAKGKDFILQYSHCIAGKCIVTLQLYCKRQERRLWDCIARWV